MAVLLLMMIMAQRESNAKNTTDEVKPTIFHDFLGRSCASDSSPAAAVKPGAGGDVQVSEASLAASASIGGSSGGSRGPISATSYRFNAHASNIVSAIYIATGPDPAQNIESSHCITMMEAVNQGKDLHVSVTMPSFEVGMVGGCTQLASQSACLNLFRVKGASKESTGSNARLLATIVAAFVLAGELILVDWVWDRCC